MWRTVSCCVLVCLVVVRSCAQQFTISDQPLARPPVVQVDGQGRAFVAADRQLLRLNSELVLEQNVSLSAGAVNISLSTGGERLVVCLEDSSCAIYNSDDLSAGPSSEHASVLANVLDRIALFTAGNSFYVGSHDPSDAASSVTGTIRLQQVGGLNGSDRFIRATDYPSTLSAASRLQRNFFSGFQSGSNAYFILSDHEPSSTRNIKVMRVCHVTGCPGGSTTCGFTALYEETINCGDTVAVAGDGVCGMSVVEDFAGTQGPSILISRCRQKSVLSNVVCFLPVAEVDRVMNTRYNMCSTGMGTIDLQWPTRNAILMCNNPQDFEPQGGVCDFDGELGNTNEDNILSPSVINIGVTTVLSSSGDSVRSSTISASVAVQIEGFSLVVVAYTLISSTTGSPIGNFVSMFEVSSLPMPALTLNDGFNVRPTSSLVRTLQWHAGLDYVLTATDTEVLRIPLEECSSNTSCSSCVTNSNPLCGWCVVENKCSRQSQCQNGNSTLSSRWTPSTSASPSTQCITITITPDQYLLDNPQLLSVSVGGAGLPVLLENEFYSCHFEDSLRRFNITVPAMEVTPGTAYTCNITNQIPEYTGIQAVMRFSFVNSVVNISFAMEDNAMTIFDCNNVDGCTECLASGSACGWCVVNKLCRGTAQDCVSTSTFLQLDEGTAFVDVCPLLDLKNGTANYTQHVRIASDLQLTTRNLPDTVPGFTYSCGIRDLMFPAVRNSETSLTCQVPVGELTSTDDSDISILWTGPGVNMHQIDTIRNPKVILYDCTSIVGPAAVCSSCVGSRATPGILCGWCDVPATCSIAEECMNSPPNPFYTSGPTCPDHRITSISPTSGPPSGGTIITIIGRDLGVTFEDFNAPNSITVGSMSCTPLSMGYESGATVLCQTQPGLPNGTYELVVTLSRDGELVPVTAAEQFTITKPTLSSVVPNLGPIAGGSELRVIGTGLNISSTTTVALMNGTERAVCSIRGDRTATEITCVTPPVSAPQSGPVIIMIDNEVVMRNGVQFNYRENPTFTSVQPPFFIPVGGVNLTFTGSNLDVAQNPTLIINGTSSPCTVVDSSTLTCTAPSVNAPPQSKPAYRLVLDDAPFPSTLPPELQLTVRPNPTGFRLLTQSVQRSSLSNFIQIQGTNLDSILSEEIMVSVGGQECTNPTKSRNEESNEVVILCEAPTNPTLDDSNGAVVNVSIGTNLFQVLNETVLYESGPASIPLTIIIPAVAAPAVIVFLCCVLWIAVIICLSRRAGKKKEQQYSNLIAKMELLEYEMADECKRAFTELQTDLADLVQISSDKNLPYRDFRTFAMRFLFPKAGDDHPVLLPLEVTGKVPEEEVMKQLGTFRELIMDKKFLLVFVHTLESQPGFSLQDKCDVASLLMVAFQNDLDYATEILQTLLAELMRKTIAKSHPKLLLRRTDSIAEKMLANWQAFLLFPYLLEHVGEPLFILYRAIKSQLEKGPVDVISGEAKNSLSEEKLLRQHMDVKPVEGVVQHEDDEEIPIKLWDCDSVTQAKEKILDALYKNTPVSKRPQLTGVDLELIGKGANGVTLRDQDATNSKDGEWVKVNTLGHYKLDEMSKNHVDNPKLPIPKFRLIHRTDRPLSGVSNFDTLGTIISNISAANRSSMVMSASELNHLYHLVKPDPETGEGGAGQKIMSEVFLTRLLSTKRILQPYVDKLFEAIFAVPHGKMLPKAIKSLFDFLDLQASELGITDADILHSWKTNSVPLRFWVNVIKNPDFVFDINKSATVDSCLTVIAQAYIDATSTADIKYTKDTPSARLLYVNEVKKYKAGVENYYSVIQSLPKLSNNDMMDYLRETAQVCANSVKQYDPTVVNDPALMTRRLYFVTESALYELFKYASEYSDDIIDSLNEEGLTIPAAQFDQLRRALS